MKDNNNDTTLSVCSTQLSLIPIANVTIEYAKKANAYATPFNTVHFTMVANNNDDYLIDAWHTVLGTIQN